MATRGMLAGLGLALQLTITGTAGAADDWPSKPVHLIVPYSPGGNTDLIARTLGEPLSEAIGQPVIVENKAGAGGTIGVGAAGKAAPDGYTLVVGDIATMGINPHVYSNLTYDPVEDFTAVVQITSVSLVMGAGPKLGVDSFDAFLELARTDPDAIDYASAGIGTAQHLAFELFSSLTDTSGVHIPFKGSGPARTALISGEVGVMIDGTLVPSIESGQLVALAVTGADRSKVLPDVPTLKEKGVDMVYTSWHGIFVPKGTDPAIVARLNAALDEIMSRPDIREPFEARNILLVGGSPADFEAFVATEAVKLGKLVEQAGAAGTQ